MSKKKERIQSQAFTRSYNGISKVLTCTIHISEYDPKNQRPTPTKRNIEAIIDTGAMGSVITEKLSKDANLTPSGKMYVKGAYTPEPKLTSTYLVNIFLPNRVSFVGTKVTESESLVGGYDALIGMDIITSGDLAVTNLNGKTKVSFQYPSTHDIDFAKEIKRVILERQIKEKFKRDRANYNKSIKKGKRRKIK